MSYSWIKTRAAIFRNPAFMRLIKADCDNLRRWLQVCLVAAEADNEGRLTYGRGRSWTVEDLAEYCDKETAEEFGLFIDLALSLDMLEAESDGTLVLVDWEDWYGQSALTNAERQKRWRERQKSQKAVLDTPVTDRNEEPLRDHNESNDPKQSRAEQNKKQIREEAEQSRAEGALQSAACLPAFSEKDFFENAEKLCRQLTGKRKFSQDDLQRLKATLATAAFLEYADWRHRAGALELATQRAQYRIAQGETVKARWRWMLSWAEEHLATAKERIEINDFAREHGHDPKPLRWTP